MATQSPFSFPFALPNPSLLLKDLGEKLTQLQPPVWAVDEVQRRIVLLLNHVLMQEPEATARLARVKGRIVRVQWRTWSMTVAATPAGLLDLASADADSKSPDLTIRVADDSPLALVQKVFAGGKPAINIEGDVQLAAEINWLVDHVSWDVEEDLSRILGDAPAHALVSAAKQVGTGLKSFLVTKVEDADSAASAKAPANTFTKAGS